MRRCSHHLLERLGSRFWLHSWRPATLRSLHLLECLVALLTLLRKVDRDRRGAGKKELVPILRKTTCPRLRSTTLLPRLQTLLGPARLLLQSILAPSFRSSRTASSIRFHFLRLRCFPRKASCAGLASKAKVHCSLCFVPHIYCISFISRSQCPPPR